MMKAEAFDLEARLIAFAVRIIKLVDALPKTAPGNHIRSQLLRSGTSPAANYAEAQSAESRTDFAHKLKIVVEELRETRVWLLLIQEAALINPIAALDSLVRETNELIAIFVASLKTTAKKRE